MLDTIVSEIKVFARAARLDDSFSLKATRKVSNFEIKIRGLWDA